MGDQGVARGDFRGIVRVAVAAVAAALVLAVTSCGLGATSHPPDPAAREPFARSVVEAAIGGNSDDVAALVGPAMTNAGPEAQQLVDATRGWGPGTWHLGVRSDFPSPSNVTAWRDGQQPTVRFAIPWTGDRWSLAIGEPRNAPSGGAKIIDPATRTRSTPSAPEPGASAASSSCPTATSGRGTAPGAPYGADSLSCRTFSSSWAQARGRNLYLLTATPVQLRFDRRAGTTAVLSTACGDLTVPVDVDDFGLVPDAAGMTDGAGDCLGAENHAWLRDFFGEPSVYQLDSAELSITNPRGQIRFAAATGAG